MVTTAAKSCQEFTEEESRNETMILVLASVLSAPSLPASAVTIVWIAVAALLAGGARFIGTKMLLPDWASLAVALFVFGLFLVLLGVL
jgi:hypothetical protein